MKTVPIPISRQLPDAVLYAEDVDAIVKVLETTCTDVEIRVPGYVFDSVDELKQHSPNTINNLTVAGREPYVTVDLSTDGNSVFAFDSGPIDTGLVEKINQIAVRRRRLFFRRRYMPLQVAFIAVFAFVCIMWLTGVIENEITRGITRLGANVIGSAILTVWILRTDRPRSAVIHLCRRAERPSFVVRKKDDLIFAVVSALIGALLGIGGTVVAQRLGVASDQATLGTEVETKQVAP